MMQPSVREPLPGRARSPQIVTSDRDVWIIPLLLSGAILQALNWSRRTMSTRSNQY
jgi:hypothetical protein